MITQRERPSARKVLRRAPARINVGGKNLIRMPALKACFETPRLDDVATYIQSGNVLFSLEKDLGRLKNIEKMLSGEFG